MVFVLLTSLIVVSNFYFHNYFWGSASAVSAIVLFLIIGSKGDK